MSVLKSEIDTRSETFQRNNAAMQAQVDDLKKLVEGIKLGGGEAARRYFVSSNSSRPISMRRISLVPAPIS